MDANKKRYLEHLEARGVIPKGYACGGRVKKMAYGGEVEGEGWEDDGWNQHEDTSGEPPEYDTANAPSEFMAFGGRIVVPEDDQDDPGSLYGHQYGRPNFAGPAEEDQDDEITDAEVSKRLAMALQDNKRKQLRSPRF